MDDLGFEMVAASLRADAGDLRTFVEVLASKLDGALPGRVVVERKSSGLFSRTTRVRQISVESGDFRYQLIAHDGGRLEPRRAKAVRGIVLSTDEMQLDEWIEELSRVLADEAKRSETSRLALERLLNS